MRLKHLWQVLKLHKHPIKFLIGIVLMKFGLSRLFHIKQDGFMLRFYPSTMSFLKWSDPAGSNYGAEANFFRNYLRPGNVVIDVGANIGFYTLVCAVLVGNCGRVYAFEPHPRIFRYLKGNIALNKCKNISAYNVALGNRAGTFTFSDEKQDDMNFVVQNNSGIKIRMVKLDELAITNDCIAMLKIDVEGYEKFVVEGGMETLRRVQCIFFESWKEHFGKFGYETRDLFKVIFEQGFHIFRIVDNFIFPIHEDYSSIECENLVAVREISEFLQRTGFQLGQKLTDSPESDVPQ